MKSPEATGTIGSGSGSMVGSAGACSSLFCGTYVCPGKTVYSGMFSNTGIEKVRSRSVFPVS